MSSCDAWTDQQVIAEEEEIRRRHPNSFLGAERRQAKSGSIKGLNNAGFFFWRYSGHTETGRNRRGTRKARAILLRCLVWSVPVISRSRRRVRQLIDAGDIS